MSLRNDDLTVIHEKITILARDQTHIRERLDTIMETVQAHSDIIRQMSDTHAMTTELLDLFLAAKGGFKVIGWMGAAVKFLWPVAALGVAIFIFIKTGNWKFNP